MIILRNTKYYKNEFGSSSTISYHLTTTETTYNHMSTSDPNEKEKLTPLLLGHKMVWDRAGEVKKTDEVIF